MKAALKRSTPKVWNRWFAVAAMALVAGAVRPAVDAGAQRRPNVLFIAVDDLNTHLGCYGNQVVRSPNVDRLARWGVRFERAYCQYPLCNPSRTSLLTGRRPTTTHVMDNQRWFRQAMPEVVTLPEQFRKNGYFTARVGKIFHGGLDDDRGWIDGGEPYAPRPSRTPQQNADRQRDADRWVALQGDGEGQPDHRTATRAVELLRTSREQPFFLAVGFVKPHVPLISPKKYFDLYDPARLRLPLDFAPLPLMPGPDLPADALRPNFDLFIRREAPEELARQGIAAYYAATSFMDAQLGRVLDELEWLKLRENTVVVFFGDHGWHLGEKGMWSKMSLFEVSTRVPCILVDPRGRREPGEVCRRTVELVDLYPTLAELCGLPSPQRLEGESLAPLLQRPNREWDHPALTFLRRGQSLGRSVRTERFRYTEWDEGRRAVELYDHDSDPAETRNLAGDPAQAGTIARLKRVLTEDAKAQNS